MWSYRFNTTILQLSRAYKIQGKEQNNVNKLIEETLLLEESDIKMLVVKCIPEKLAEKITKYLSIPVIGIGSEKTDRQIFVMHDLLGITEGKYLVFQKIFFLQMEVFRKQFKNTSMKLKKEFIQVKNIELKCISKKNRTSSYNGKFT